MGAFLSEHFSAGWKKEGTFTIQPGCAAMNFPRAARKVGGNVVAYFCTPDLKILHAVWGPVPAEQFLSQAKWAVDLWKGIAGLNPGVKMAAARSAHEANPYRNSNRNCWSGQASEHTARYDHLVEKVLTPLDKSAAELFQQLVNEMASDKEVRVDFGFHLGIRN